MTDRDALLAAILANPEDDTPRLVYADWLDEHGTDEDRTRAEFIRLECEEDRIDEDDLGREACARRKAIGTRTQEIEKKYKRAWGAALAGRKGPLRGRDCFFHFRRGFPDRAYAPADRLIAEGDALFRLAPITYVDAKGVTPDSLGALLACPWLANVRSLTLSGPGNPDAPRPDWEALAACRHLGNLDYIWLDRGRLSRDGAERLAAANPFPRLRQFMVCDCDLGAAGVAGLFGGPVFGRLEEVYLNRCDVDTAAVGVLAKSPGLAGLAKLSLPSQPLSSEAVRVLANGRYWPNLRELVLYGCQLGDAAVAALAAAGPTRLRVLQLSMNRIGPTGVEALVGSRFMGSLEVLDLASNPVWTQGVLALVRSPHLGKLRRLHLGGCGIGPEGAKALAACPALSGLLWLTLHSNPILKDGALAIADSPHLAGLDYLPVSNVRGKARERLKERFGDRVRF